MKTTTWILTLSKSADYNFLQLSLLLTKVLSADNSSPNQFKLHIKSVCVRVRLLGAGVSGGCVARRGPGPAHPDSPATGGEPVPPQQPVHQRPPE